MNYKVGLISILTLLTVVLVGCGGGGSNDSGTGSTGGGGATIEPAIPDGIYTANVHVDISSGKVIVTPVSGNTRAAYSGTAVTVMASNLINDAGSGQVGINFTVKNNLPTPIGSATYPVSMYYSFVSSQGANSLKSNVSSLFLAGSTQGFANGSFASAKFNGLNGITSAPGYPFICDSLNNRLRIVTSTHVSSFGTGQASDVDGLLGSCSFNDPVGIDYSRVDGYGVVIERNGNRLRSIRIDTDGNPDPTVSGGVFTVAGSGAAGSADGVGTAATFNHPQGVVITGGETGAISDTGNNKVRTYFVNSSEGPFSISTLAGSGTAGLKDGLGAAAQFNQPQGICNVNGLIFVADTGNSCIRAITSDGYVTTIAGLAGAGFADGIGNQAKFLHPVGISVAGTSPTQLYVADTDNHAIRLLTYIGPYDLQDIQQAGNWQVSTIAGDPSLTGFTMGAGLSTGFSAPVSVANRDNNLIYVSDREANKVATLSVNKGLQAPQVILVWPVNNAGTDQLNGTQTSFRAHFIASTLSPGVTSPTTEWKFAVPAGTTGFDFVVTVGADPSLSAGAGLPSAIDVGSAQVVVSQFPVNPGGSILADFFVSDRGPTALSDARYFVGGELHNRAPSGDIDKLFFGQPIQTFASWSRSETGQLLSATPWGDLGAATDASVSVNRQDLWVATGSSLAYLISGGTRVNIGQPTYPQWQDGTGATASVFADYVSNAGKDTYFTDGNALRIVTLTGLDRSNPADFTVKTLFLYNSFPGTPTNRARLAGVTALPNGNVAVLDEGRATVFVVNRTGAIVFTIGRNGSQIVDGAASVAKFIDPKRITSSNDGVIYVSDSGYLRKITADGTVSTVVGTPNAPNDSQLGSGSNWVDGPMCVGPDGEVHALIGNTASPYVNSATTVETAGIYLAKP